MGRIAETKVLVDGLWYQPGEEIPDLGSFECVSTAQGIRRYEGLSKDIGKLPTNVPAGSRAKCVDTGVTYTFHKGTNKWWKTSSGTGAGGSGGGSTDTGDITIPPDSIVTDEELDQFLGDLNLFG